MLDRSKLSNMPDIQEIEEKREQEESMVNEMLTG